LFRAGSAADVETGAARSRSLLQGLTRPFQRQSRPSDPDWILIEGAHRSAPHTGSLMTSKERIIQLTDQNDDELLPYLLLQAPQLCFQPTASYGCRKLQTHLNYVSTEEYLKMNP